MKKLTFAAVLIFLTGCSSIPKFEMSENSGQLNVNLSEKIINKVSKVKSLYDLALIAKGLI